MIMKICLAMLVFVVFCCLAAKVLSGPILWPSGRYGLPMPTSRCPRSNGFHWITGYLYQDLENDFSLTKVSSNAHFRGWVLNDVARYFCIKNHSSSAVDTNRKSWPAGQYCIYQKGSSCPAGMQSGSVLWDDENVANGTNKNRNSGSLPAGVYNQDTKIFFCCQNAGSTGNPIELPIDKPFYLIALTPDCQRVLNAVHTREYIVYDTEDDNNHDQQTFPFPFGADYPEPRICYCYYQACLWTLTALKGTFASPFYPQDYYNKARCKWHITVPWNYTISLTFNDFRLERSCCMCDHVEVWETLTNGSEVLIESFCDAQNRRPDSFKPIRSRSNNMTVIFRSDHTVNAKGFAASYEAIPISAVKPTIPSTPTVKKNKTTTSQCLLFFLCASTAVNPTTATNPNVNKNGTTTTASAVKTSSAAHSISKPSSAANTLFTEQSNTTPFPSTKTPTTTPPFTTGSDVTTKHSIESRTSTTATGEASVHDARNESEAKETMTYVIIGVVTSLIVIGGAVVGAVLCFCRKCPTKIYHNDQDKFEVTVTTSQKAVIGMANISLPQMHQVSEDHGEECYTDVNKLEKCNVLYDHGDGLHSSEKEEFKETENALYVCSDGYDEERYTDVNKLEKSNVLYDHGDGRNTTDKDEFKETENPLYVSSDDTVQASDNPMYESVGDTLKRTINDGSNEIVYERMI